VFATLSDRLSASFRNLRGKGRLTEADIDATAREIRIALLEADVALPVVRGFIARVKERARSEAVSTALNPAQQIVKIVDEELVTILGGQTRRLRYAKTPPTVFLLAGLQGSGKTTLAGKLGRWLKAQGHTPLLVACDLQRPNAVQQLQIVGDRAGVPVYAPERGNDGAAGLDSDPSGTRSYGDPVRVARDGVAQARARQHDVVIVDTAGRLGVDADLMAQAAGIRDAVQPDEILFVLDAMIGQDAVTTAKAFLDGVGFDGVVLTKLDGDARGGAALSVSEVTGRPIMFASSGEKLEDFDVFHPDRMAGRILDMGDMLTLIEKAEQAFDADETAALAGKLGGADGGLTLEDFLSQMQAVRKMGPLGKVFSMLPGMGQMRDQLDAIDDRELNRVEAVIRSMTPLERGRPQVIDGSRRLRIARGSGTTVTDVSGLVERFLQARKMMKQLSGKKGMAALNQMMGGNGPHGPGGGTAGRGLAPGAGALPGMPGLPGAAGGGGRRQPAKKKGKAGGRSGRSGNPAKRAGQGVELEPVAEAPGTSSAPAGGGAFGGGASGVGPADLPADLQELIRANRGG
jgi:signal recognition particle subunit SRP54